MNTIPWSVVRYFTKAGWHHGRAVDVPQTYPAAHPATEILREFSGLKVGKTGSGQECATTLIRFHPLDDLGEEVLELAECLDTTLLGIGSDASGCYFYSDTLSRIFVFEIAAGSVWLQGWTFGEAAERLILGKHAYPLLLPSQPSIGFYGLELYHGDARILPLDKFKSATVTNTL